MKKELKKGDIWFLVDAQWWKQWKKYVGYDSWDMEGMGNPTCHPGPIDNSALLKDPKHPNACFLQEYLVEELDYWPIPVGVFRRLVSWYGIKDHHVIPRKYSMSTEERVLQYVQKNASRGDPDSVLDAVDKFCRETEWAMNVGDVKGVILDRFVKETAPQTMLELGTYMGYSAIRVVRLLPETAKFLTVEFNTKYAAVAKEMIAFAGLQNRIIQITSDSADVIPQLKKKYDVVTFDMVFMDHWKDVYVRDIKLLETNNLLRKGTVVVADNIIYPGAPEYADYVRTCGKYDSTFHESNFEYSDEIDGLEKSVYRG